MTGMDDRREIGDYRFMRLLGKGGMGAVYEAVGPDGVRRAVKVFTLDHGNRDFLLRRFQVEAQMLRQLGDETSFVRTGARFVRVWDSGEEDGTPWFAMDLVLNAAGEPETRDCNAVAWARPERLRDFDFAGADLEFVKRNYAI